jgi:site-specific DNA-cytosine methylase
MNLLELFAGSRSIGKVGNKLGMNVFSVDWEKYENIDLCKDVSNLAIEDIPFIPDVVWASPDCTTYTIAAISKHRNGVYPKSEYANQCDITNQHFISLIKSWLDINPNMIFFIENPRGMLRKMPWMQEFKRHTVWYCRYGDDRAKPTDIWTNSNNWIPRPICHNGNKDCHHTPAPRGSKTGTQGRKDSYDRSMIPEELCYEVLHSTLK